MHVITGEIRKDVYTKEGNGNKGPWKMYAIELSESFKDKDGNKQYTNYRATFFANENQISYYDDWIKKGNVVSVSCKNLEVQTRDSNGTMYITLNMVMPNLDFFQSSNSGGQGRTQNTQQTRTAQQQQSRQQAPKPNDAPPMDFDSDIPF